VIDAAGAVWRAETLRYDTFAAECTRAFVLIPGAATENLDRPLFHVTGTICVEPPGPGTICSFGFERIPQAKSLL
jgi:hypothetical protein